MYAGITKGEHFPLQQFLSGEKLYCRESASLSQNKVFQE